jgi:hypothetical protein
MGLALAISCISSVAFLLRFLIALVKESRDLASQRKRIVPAKEQPVSRRGRVIMMDPEVARMKFVFPIHTRKETGMV